MTTKPVTKSLTKPAQRPTTIAAYIDTAPSVRQPHMRAIYALLKSVAPNATEAIKWGTPFFIEPRFLFSFSAHKSHLNFAPMAWALAPFRDEIAAHQTTENFLQIPYTQPLPVDLIRRIAKARVRALRDNPDTSFWAH